MKNSILLIEDKNGVTKYLEKSLEADFKIFYATTLSVALDYLSKNQFSLIIMDQEIEDKIKEKISFKNPILILTDKKKVGQPTLKNYYIQKPFSFLDFIKIVSDIILSNTENSHILNIDTLSIDTKKRVAYRDSKPILLTKKEYTLLLFLLKNKEKAVPRSDLLENVWGMQIDPFSNTIEAHVFSLRKKIDRGHKIKLIHTIPKFGYRVSVEK